jgi:CheY-like chemotaxis protein
VTVVLVVDDEPDVRLVARVILNSAGYDVVEASSGEEALAALDEPLRPDVVLLDVRMPGIDGWEVLRRVRAHPELGRVPVVVFTAHADPDAGVDYEHFLMKPFKPAELIDAIAHALGSA